MVDVSKAVVIVPTYNEIDNIERLAQEVFAHTPGISILFVDDDSPDGTGTFIKKMRQGNSHIHLLERQNKEGLGRAYIAGFKHALQMGFEYLFEMDADFSHNPKKIPAFLEAIEEADLVIGSRYIRGVNVVNWPMRRLLLSYFANKYSHWITGMPVQDSTGGYKCFRRRVLETIDLDNIKSNGYAFQIEINFKAWKKGFRIMEIPIVFIDREFGESKLSKSIMWEAIFLVWKLRISSIFHKL
jgi:dolichol-phosphate mannosyltransferase